MSWPADGEPRFIPDVQEPVEGQKSRTAVVYDRARGFAVVFSTTHLGFAAKKRPPSVVAAEAAARLNAA